MKIIRNQPGMKKRKIAYSGASDLELRVAGGLLDANLGGILAVSLVHEVLDVGDFLGLEGR